MGMDLRVRELRTCLNNVEVELVVCMISKGIEKILPIGRMIATILLALETSIPTVFTNMSLKKIMQWINSSFTHGLFDLLWCDMSAPMAI